mmetsp:Transcript_21783/g.29980  ORF Transcript_21783/g.29980 Transcript_21783/m.29980 type:complete len:186 (+) Transcript_21783:109-666(+)|eukprot:CAMPEP_0201491180 /NCGR_PEP_ID=MMETSP0151_2-20130828/28877_1 /ASSEMBLY_ACC=CAM_ASM_000257 /TAXON_ID=200890 /ORGANISM="Paramoeba atlantica, Strain 621/1 / CCAP 1560/9" /LENGTH=185 /DNA_ID=CAMNT_0047877417 /DNA_START=62 /DNA_END=619 /DNA_ORIENTATION=-
MASSSTTSTKSKIQKARDYKDAGNSLFKEDEFEKAKFQYHLGILEVKSLLSQQDSKMTALLPSSATTKLSEEETKEVQELSVFLHSNLALCNLKEGKPERAVKACTEALNINPKHQKSLYRRGKAYLENSSVRNLELARADLELAKELAPSDKATESLLKKLKVLEEKEEQVLKKQYAKMFGGNV